LRNGTAYVANDCSTSGSCDVYSSGYLVPVTDPNAEKALMLMSIDSAQRALAHFDASINDSSRIDFYVDDDADLPQSCPTACAESRTRIYMPTNLAHQGDRATHEVGHVLHMREFGQDWLRDDCSLNGSGWSPGSLENESCATAEGFASYVGVVAWYDPNDSTSVPFYSSWNVETATPLSATCSTNAGYPIQVTRTFWDMDDWNNEAGAGAAAGDDDTQSYSSTSLLDRWDNFPDGTGNRDDGENDADGVNMRDYDANTTTDFMPSLEHNCVESQDNG
jgi:hypothetical protein